MENDDILEELENFQGSYEGAYSEWSDDYFSNHRDYYVGVLSVIDEHLSGPLLDVGAAPYHITTLLQEKGIEVSGLDIEPKRMEKIIVSNNIDIKKCNIETDRFPFGDNEFSGVIFTEVLEHLRINPIWTLKEIRRVLKPDGKLLLTTPNLTSIYNINSYLSNGVIIDPYDEYKKIDDLGHMGHVREYTPSEVRSLLEKTDFNVVMTDFANWESKTWRDRTTKHNFGIFVSKVFPQLKKLQIHVSTPDEDN